MSKGGTQTTTVEIPPELKEAALQNMDIANEVAALGYTPYQGPTTAAFSPQQIAAMQGIDQTAAAFGMPSAMGQTPSQAAANPMDSAAMYTALTGMPPPTDYGGFQGYSAMPLYEAGIDAVPAAQRAAIESFVMDPVTGAPPTNASVPAPKTQFDAEGNVTQAETIMDEPAQTTPDMWYTYGGQSQPLQYWLDQGYNEDFIKTMGDAIPVPAGY